jgi:hypothetical protein
VLSQALDTIIELARYQADTTFIGVLQQILKVLSSVNGQQHLSDEQPDC